MNILKKLTLLEILIDDRIDMFGVRNTISYFLDQDFTKEDLLEMGFDEADVDFVINHPDDDYDCQ